MPDVHHTNADQDYFKFDTVALAELCRRYQVARLSLFGSALRHDLKPSSDLDLIIEFLPTASPPPSLFDLGGLQQELSALCHRDVDLKTPALISRYFRAQVLAEAKVVYAA